MSYSKSSPAFKALLVMLLVAAAAAPIVFAPKASPHLIGPVMFLALLACRDISHGWVRPIWLLGIILAVVISLLDLVILLTAK